MSERRQPSKAFLLALFMGTLGLGSGAVTALAAAPHYSLVGHIPGAQGVVAWDYATIDAARGTLFLATIRSGADARYVGRIAAFDLQSGRLLPTIIADAMPHKVVILDHGLLAASDAASNSVAFFDETTGRFVGSVPTGKPPGHGGWHNPDSLVRDPATGLLVAVNHDSGALALVSVARRRVVGRVRVGGILEEAAAEGNGMVAVNDSSQAQIVVVSVKARTIVRRITLGNCQEPTGIVYDSADRVVMSVCSNGLAKFVDAQSGRELASIGVGKEADGIMYDARRKLVMVAGDGTFSVIRLGSRHSITLVQTLPVPQGTRLGAVDGASGRVYLPSAGHDLRAPPVRLPGLPPIPRVVPGTFGLLVLAPVAAH